MIKPVILAGILYAHDIAYAFYDTDLSPVPRSVGTDRALLVIGNHPADPAITDLVPEPVDRLREMVDVLGGLLEKMEGKAQGAPFSYSGKRADRLNRIFQNPGGIMLVVVSHQPCAVRSFR